MKKIFSISLFVVLIIFFLATPHFSKAESDTPTTPTPLLAGQVIKLDFRIPGIGSTSGNIKPLHTTRSILINFYSTDVNSEDKSVKPLKSVLTSATYDSDELSRTFGEYINPNINLGQQVPDGFYQISFQVNNSLPTLVKEKNEDIAGHKFDIRSSYAQTIEISNQTVVSGDIYPSGVGDNLMDINDYKTLTGCYGIKIDSPSCKNKNYADLNDDGLIDGTDYNIMSSSFKILLDRGLPVPTELFPNQPKPTTTVSKNKIDKPTATPENKKKVNTKKGSPVLAIFAILFIIILIIALVVFLLKRKTPSTFNKKFADKQKAQHGDSSGKDQQAEEEVEKEFFVKKQTIDAEGRNVLMLTDDNGPMLGYYKGEVTDGFAQVKGVIRKEGSKVFMDVSKIAPETEPKPQT